MFCSLFKAVSQPLLLPLPANDLQASTVLLSNLPAVLLSGFLKNQPREPSPWLVLVWF